MPDDRWKPLVGTPSKRPIPPNILVPDPSPAPSVTSDSDSPALLPPTPERSFIHLRRQGQYVPRPPVMHIQRIFEELREHMPTKALDSENSDDLGWLDQLPVGEQDTMQLMADVFNEKPLTVNMLSNIICSRRSPPSSSEASYREYQKERARTESPEWDKTTLRKELRDSEAYKSDTGVPSNPERYKHTGLGSSESEAQNRMPFKRDNVPVSGSDRTDTDILSDFRPRAGMGKAHGEPSDYLERKKKHPSLEIDSYGNNLANVSFTRTLTKDKEAEPLALNGRDTVSDAFADRKLPSGKGSLFSNPNPFSQPTLVYHIEIPPLDPLDLDPLPDSYPAGEATLVQVRTGEEPTLPNDDLSQPPNDAREARSGVQSVHEDQSASQSIHEDQPAVQPIHQEQPVAQSTPSDRQPSANGAIRTLTKKIERFFSNDFPDNVPQASSQSRTRSGKPAKNPHTQFRNDITKLGPAKPTPEHEISRSKGALRKVPDSRTVHAPISSMSPLGIPIRTLVTVHDVPQRKYVDVKIGASKPPSLDPIEGPSAIGAALSHPGVSGSDENHGQTLPESEAEKETMGDPAADYQGITMSGALDPDDSQQPPEHSRSRLGNLSRSLGRSFKRTSLRTLGFWKERANGNDEGEQVDPDEIEALRGAIPRSLLFPHGSPQAPHPRRWSAVLPSEPVCHDPTKSTAEEILLTWPPFHPETVPANVPSDVQALPSAQHETQDLEEGEVREPKGKEPVREPKGKEIIRESKPEEAVRKPKGKEIVWKPKGKGGSRNLAALAEIEKNAAQYTEDDYMSRAMKSLAPSEILKPTKRESESKANRSSFRGPGVTRIKTRDFAPKTDKVEPDMDKIMAQYDSAKDDLFAAERGEFGDTGQILGRQPDNKKPSKWRPQWLIKSFRGRKDSNKKHPPSFEGPGIPRIAAKDFAPTDTKQYDKEKFSEAGKLANREAREAREAQEAHDARNASSNYTDNSLPTTSGLSPPRSFSGPAQSAGDWLFGGSSNQTTGLQETSNTQALGPTSSNQSPPEPFPEYKEPEPETYSSRAAGKENDRDAMSR